MVWEGRDWFEREWNNGNSDEWSNRSHHCSHIVEWIVVEAIWESFRGTLWKWVWGERETLHHKKDGYFLRLFFYFCLWIYYLSSSLCVIFYSIYHCILCQRLHFYFVIIHFYSLPSLLPSLLSPLTFSILYFSPPIIFPPLLSFSSPLILPHHIASSYSPLCVVTGQTSGIRAKQHGAQHRHNRETEGDNTAEDITRAGSYTASQHTHTPHTALIILHRIRELNPLSATRQIFPLFLTFFSLSLTCFSPSLSPFSLALLSLSLIFFSLFSVSHSSFLSLFLHCIPGGERGRARQR